ncbi:TPA: MFS transporter [Streptococcus suis]|nr:MFS transporter [Streptococcus suis]HEP1835672.1 MFS transporter [Streptococcus suis]
MKSIVTKYFIILSGVSIGTALFNPILYIFLLTQGFSHYQLGIYLALFFVFSFLTEVPCGAITDTIGVRNTLVLSFCLRALGLLLLLSNIFQLLLLSSFISAVAESFQSGTVQSWVVNSLDEIGEKEKIPLLFSRSSIISSILTMLFGFVSSKVLFNYDIKLPIIVSVLTFVFLCLFVLLLFSSSTDKKKIDFSNIFIDSFQTLKSTLAELVLIKELKLILVLMLLPAVLDVGPANQWQEVFHDSIFTDLSGYIWIFISLFGMLGGFISEKIQKITNNRIFITTLLFINILLIIFIGVLQKSMLTLLLFLLYILTFTILSIRINITLHNEIVVNNEHRTTIVSLYYAIESFIMSLFIFINGLLSDLIPILKVWLIFAIAIACILIYLGARFANESKK